MSINELEEEQPTDQGKAVYVHSPHQILRYHVKIQNWDNKETWLVGNEEMDNPKSDKTLENALKEQVRSKV